MLKHLSIWQRNSHSRSHSHGQLRSIKYNLRVLSIMAGILTLTFLFLLESSSRIGNRNQSRWQLQLTSDLNKTHILAQCTAIRLPAGPTPDFHQRVQSDRFEPGTGATLIMNATIWTGRHGGREVLYGGDILLDRGLVKAIGKIPPTHIGNDVEVVNAGGSWVTPGLVDLHSHVGVFSVPVLTGALDVSSQKGPINPWLRSIDALNTHDDAYKLAIAGGVTSAQVLPGSGTNIGGQAFFIKYREMSEHSPTSMVIDPPHTLNGTRPIDPLQPPRWRHLKQACGENLRRHGNRMDAAWAFREAYNEARKVKDAQDEFCRMAERGQWEQLAAWRFTAATAAVAAPMFEGDTGNGFPESLKWEMLVDVLRGRVKISNHCYEAVDLDMIVRLTNEFKFHIASFHHASETWLVPGVLKRMWGGPPAAAIFASNFRYKREAYRGSEFAASVLASHDIPVVLKANPVINSRYLLHEAQQAHYYGLASNLALASVTSTPATAGGMAHRIGILQLNSDADLVLWDSHPLQLGATPKQVWIDGIRQLENPVVGEKGEAMQRVPKTPDWERERKEAVEWEGLPPLGARREVKRVVFGNVSEVWTRIVGGSGLKGQVLGEIGVGGKFVVVVDGKIVCIGKYEECSELAKGDFVHVDLKGGGIYPGLTTYGAPIGLEEITQEASTGDGPRVNPLLNNAPSLIPDKGTTLRAVDALQFGLRDSLLAYISGVTLSFTSLASESLFSGPSNTFNGISVLFNTGAHNALEPHAILKRHVAIHVAISSPRGGRGAVAADWPSVSMQIAALRELLLNGSGVEGGEWFSKVVNGKVPLIIDVTSADTMATLIALKTEIETQKNSTIYMAFSRATEAHLIAKEIATAGVGVIVRPSRPFPQTWSERRISPGPPLEPDSQIVKLVRHNVMVGVGVIESWQARNTRFDVGWAYFEANGRLTRAEALALATTNLEALFGVTIEPEQAELVAYSGGSLFNFESKVEAIISPERELVDLV